MKVQNCVRKTIPKKCKAGNSFKSFNFIIFTFKVLFRLFFTVIFQASRRDPVPEHRGQAGTPRTSGLAQELYPFFVGMNAYTKCIDQRTKTIFKKNYIRPATQSAYITVQGNSFTGLNEDELFVTNIIRVEGRVFFNTFKILCWQWSYMRDFLNTYSKFSFGFLKENWELNN